MTSHPSPSEVPVVTFAIPLIARLSDEQWAHTQAVLNATLASIANQTDPNFRVIVACTDLPQITVDLGDRLTVLRSESVSDGGYSTGNQDAGRKRAIAAMEAVKHGETFLMLTDADDLVSRRLVEYVRHTDDPNGYAVSEGYVLDARTNGIAPLPLAGSADKAFHRLCGSSLVFRFTPEEVLAPQNDPANRYVRLATCGHHNSVDVAVAEGRPLAEIPFRAAVYAINHGANNSALPNPYLGFHDTLARHCAADSASRLERTEDLVREFALPDRYPIQSPTVGTPPSLSVVAATFKRPDGLRRLLTALVPQVAGRDDREVVIINDGSHDDAYQAVADEFADVMRYEVLERNETVPEVRNRLWQQARGEYVVYTDDDCEPPPWWLDWLAARLAAAPETDVVIGTTRPLMPEKPTFFAHVLAHFDLVPRPDRYQEGTRLVTANAAIRRAQLAMIGGFWTGEQFFGTSEDTEVSVRLARNGAGICRDDTWYVRHEVGDGLQANVRRYFKYGYANTSLANTTSSYGDFRHHLNARRARRWRHFFDVLRYQLRLARGFSRHRVVRWAGALAASRVRLAYYDGCAAAAADWQRRSGQDR